MSVFTRLFHDLVPRGRVRLSRKPVPSPDPTYGKPREMTGFLGTLTNEQRQVALTGFEPELLGDPSKAKNR